MTKKQTSPLSAKNTNLPRIPQVLTAYIHFDQRTEKCNARYFSEFGIFLQSGNILPVGSSLSFEIEAFNQTIFLSGEVVETSFLEEITKPISGMDVRLLQPPESYRSLITKLRGGELSGELQRTSKRFEATHKVAFKNDNTFLTHYTQNLSQGGMYISTTKNIPVGSSLTLQLSIPGLSKPLALKGQISYQLDQQKAQLFGKKPGIGVQFVELSKEARDTLGDYLSRVEIFRRKMRQIDRRSLDGQGELTSHLVPELILSLADQCFTGTLEVSRGNNSRIIYFKSGKPVYVESSEPKDSLGSYLVDRGLLTPEDLAMSMQDHARDDLHHGRILLKGKMIDGATLADALVGCHESKIYNCFSWFTGNYKVTELNQFPKEVPVLPLRLYHLIIKGVHRWYDGPLIQAWLGLTTNHRIYRFGMPPPSAHLSWSVWQCLYLASTPVSIDEIKEKLSIKLEEVYSNTFALLLAGWIRILPPTSQSEDSGVSSIKPTESQEDIDLTDNFDENIESLYKSTKESNFYEILEVAPSTGTAMLRRKFFSSMREVEKLQDHPSNSFRTREQLKEIVNVLNIAYETLRIPQLRRTYVQLQPLLSEHCDSDSRIELSSYLMSSIYDLHLRNLSGALSKLNEAGDRHGVNPLVNGYLHWCMFLSNPSEYAENALQVISADMKFSEFCFFRGKIYAYLKRWDEAIRCYQDAVALEPTMQVAKANMDRVMNIIHTQRN